MAKINQTIQRLALVESMWSLANLVMDEEDDSADQEDRGSPA